jgi:hypothetical protein
MHRGSGIRIVAALVAVALVATFAALAYGAGYSAGSVNGPAVVNGATVYGPGWGWPGFFFGWHILGFIFGLFVLLFVFRLIAFAIFGHRHHGPWGYHGRWNAAPGDPNAAPGAGDQDRFAGYGPGPWGPGWHHRRWYGGPAAALDEWHRQAHGNTGPDAGPSTGAQPPAGGQQPR